MIVMECGKGEASRTMQRFDRNVPLSRRRLSNNYERDEEGPGIRCKLELEHGTVEHVQLPAVVVVRKPEERTATHCHADAARRPVGRKDERRQGLAGALVSLVVS